MYVPLCGFWLFVLFCVLFVCKCVLDHYLGISEQFSTTLNMVLMCFFLSCKANARVQLAKTGYGRHFPVYSFIIVLFRALYSVYCLCVNVYCTAANGCQPVYCLCVNVYCTAATGFQLAYCLCVNVYCTAATGCQPAYCLCVNVYCTAATGCQLAYCLCVNVYSCRRVSKQLQLNVNFNKEIIIIIIILSVTDITTLPDIGSNIIFQAVDSFENSTIPSSLRRQAICLQIRGLRNDNRKVIHLWVILMSTFLL
jgi:hypothetical protein